MKLETEFKVLMHMNQYVNVNLLQKGIYSSNKPYIYSKEETIGNLVSKAKNVKKATGPISFINDSYINNLQQCKLVKVHISIKD